MRFYQFANLEQTLMLTSAERLQPGVSNYGTASVEAAWAEVSDEFVGPLTMRCTAMFIQTFLVRHLGGLEGVITHEHLVTLADAI